MKQVDYKDKVAIDRYALADAYEKMNQLDSAAFNINYRNTKRKSS